MSAIGPRPARNATRERGDPDQRLAERDDERREGGDKQHEHHRTYRGEAQPR